VSVRAIRLVQVLFNIVLNSKGQMTYGVHDVALDALHGDISFHKTCKASCHPLPALARRSRQAKTCPRLTWVTLLLSLVVLLLDEALVDCNVEAAVGD